MLYYVILPQPKDECLLPKPYCLVNSIQLYSKRQARKGMSIYLPTCNEVLCKSHYNNFQLLMDQKNTYVSKNFESRLPSFLQIVWHDYFSQKYQRKNPVF